MADDRTDSTIEDLQESVSTSLVRVKIISRGLTLDKVVSLIAIFISVTALGMTFFQIQETVRHREVLLMPSLSIWFNYDEHLGEVGWVMNNSGFGPARLIKSEVHFKGELMGDISWGTWESIRDKLKIPEKVVSIEGRDPTDLIGRESNPLFIVFRKEEYLRENFPDMATEKWIEELASNVRIEVLYQGIYGESIYHAGVPGQDRTLDE